VSELPARRIGREALERIIQRAAELQAGELDTGEALTEAELLKLGAEVGIDGRYLRQALFEEQAGTGPGERGFLAKWIGPGRVAASRVVPGARAGVEQALEQWMAESEALTVKRRMADRTVWERQRGFFAEMKRGFGVGGRPYHLAKKAGDVTVAVTQLEPGYCHVALEADVSDARAAAATGGGAAAGGLALVAAGLFALPVEAVGSFALLALLPLGGAALAPVLAARAFRRRAATVQLALEQVLDRLERGEIKPQHRREPAPLFPIGRIAEEIRRVVADLEPPRRSSRRLPPTT
jgi:hypothetical protein